MNGFFLTSRASAVKISDHSQNFVFYAFFAVKFLSLPPAPQR
jgi:hypothetical protein